MPLPALRGSPKQVAWAEKIRNSALTHQAFSKEAYDLIERVVDATWFIANMVAGNKLVATFKEPLPHQLVDGPPPPERLATHTGEYTGAPQVSDKTAISVATAKGFAKSVSLNPVLAEIAVVALLSRLYKNDVAAQLREVALDLLEDFQQESAEKTRKDVDGIERILGPG